MKTNYFLKLALFVVALFGFNSLFAQTAKTPNFVEVVSPVINGEAKEDFAFAFENAAAWGDYNNDGYLDLLVTGVSSNWVKISALYKNNGNGTFTKVVNPFPLIRTANATWLDYNNDGNLDVFIAGTDDIGPYSALYKNLGVDHNFDFEQVLDGTFDYMNNGNNGGNSPNRYVLAGDFNNDGWVDLYMQGGNETGKVAFLYKNLNGKSFVKVENPVTGSKPFTAIANGTAAWGDYNKDGFLDLIVNGKLLDGAPEPVGANETVISAIYKNNGDGTFAEPIISLGTEAGEIDWFDYNNDGNLDYLITGVRGVYNRVTAGVDGTWDWHWSSDIYENDGTGKFTMVPPAQNGMPAGKQESSIALGDVNNDGYEDVLYMNADPNSIFLNNFGDQTFAKQELICTTPTGGSTVADFSYKGNQWGGTACLADFDRDGDLDAFTAAYGFTPRLMKNELGEGITANQAPGIPANLVSTTDNNGVVTFSWNASTDDSTPAESIKYNLYVKKAGNDSVKFLLPADLTTGRLKVNETLAPLTTTSYKMNNLGNGNFTFGVQAIDNSKVSSLFATAQFTVGTNALPNVNLNDIKVLTKGSAVQITANENIEGVVNVYDVRGMSIRKISGQINGSKIELSAGMYIVKVTSGASTVVKKVVLN